MADLPKGRIEFTDPTQAPFAPGNESVNHAALADLGFWRLCIEKGASEAQVAASARRSIAALAKERDEAQQLAWRLREQLDEWKDKAFDALALSKQANDNCESLEEQLDAARQAIEQAEYALHPNQGERPDSLLASMWLRTTYPVDHPNHVARAALGVGDSRPEGLVAESAESADVRGGES